MLLFILVLCFRVVCASQCSSVGKYCPKSGEVVYQNPSNNCKFDECPKCKTDTKTCKNGLTLKRDEKHSCSFPPCFCPDDSMYCRGGVVVERNPKLFCAFNSCPHLDDSADTVCDNDYKTCPDGEFVKRNPADKCKFFPCDNEGSAHSSTDTSSAASKNEPDSSTEKPDKGKCNTLEFKICPNKITKVFKNVTLGCKFPECPKMAHCAQGDKGCFKEDFIFTKMEGSNSRP